MRVATDTAPRLTLRRRLLADGCEPCSAGAEPFAPALSLSEAARWTDTEE